MDGSAFTAMGDWGGNSNFHIPDTVPTSPRRPQPPHEGNSGSSSIITDHERFLIAINDIVQLPNGWQCHVCDAHIAGSAYEAWAHTHDIDHRRWRPPMPKRPTELDQCLDVRDYSGAMHCKECRVRLTNYAASQSHLRGRQHIYRLSEKRNRAMHKHYSDWPAAS